jgi:tetratricopeptide (TPR) repeat protein
VNVPPERVS